MLYKLRLIHTIHMAHMIQTHIVTPQRALNVDTQTLCITNKEH